MATDPELTRQAMLVVGMHRSGTSALALALQRMGWSPGRDVLPRQAAINPQGFGENRALVEFNDSLLAQFGQRWYHLAQMPAGWLDSAAGAEAVAGARRLLAEQYADQPRILLKDPRLCLLLPLWRRALEESGIAARTVLMVRQVAAVAASLQRRDSLPPAVGVALWWHYLRQAELHSRDGERALLRYEDLLNRGDTALRLFPDLELPADFDSGVDPALNHSALHDPADAASEQLLAALQAGLPVAELLTGEQPELAPAALLPAALDALLERAAAAVDIGEQHAQALAVIADKDVEIAEASQYASDCEAVVASKDEEIAEVSRYASHCEQVVAQKDQEVAAASARAAECERAVAECERAISEWERAVAEKDAAIQHLEQLRDQRLHRLLRKLRLLR